MVQMIWKLIALDSVTLLVKVSFNMWHADTKITYRLDDDFL